MFNLFKKAAKNVAHEVKQVFAEPINVQETIEKIHADFDGASERLLKEAQEIINNSNEVNIDKSKRLQSLGFNSAKIVTKTAKEIEKKKESEEIAANILYFKQYYPFNKFITEKEIKTICEKYSLVFGDAAYYKGDVPDKNLKEMESFVLRKEDMSRHSRYERELQRYSALQMAQFSFSRQGAERHTYREYPMPTEESLNDITYSKAPFKICAPEKDFDMTYMVRTGHKIEFHVPDPIVLQPVKGGYLIVTKWGLEASDELVVNSIEN